LVFLKWLRITGGRNAETCPCGLLGFWILASFLSLLGTQIEFVDSLKQFLDFVLALSCSTRVISHQPQTTEDVRRDCMRVARLCSDVARLIKTLTGYPVDRLHSLQCAPGVQAATFSPPISIGSGRAMAMACGLTFLLVKLFQACGRQFTLSRGWVPSCSSPPPLFFSMSRGPWIGLMSRCWLLLARSNAPELVYIASLAACEISDRA